jgi:hypothetical protein
LSRYPVVDEALGQRGLNRQIKCEKGNVVTFPESTVAEKFDGLFRKCGDRQFTDAEEVASQIVDAVEEAFKQSEATEKIFVSDRGKWAWKYRPRKK